VLDAHVGSGNNPGLSLRNLNQRKHRFASKVWPVPARSNLEGFFTEHILLRSAANWHTDIAVAAAP
jgi:hypothetical protein